MSCTWHEFQVLRSLRKWILSWERVDLALTCLDKHPSRPSSFLWSHAHQVIFQWLIWFLVYFICLGYWKWMSDSINEYVCVWCLYQCLLHGGSLSSLMHSWPSEGTPGGNAASHQLLSSHTSFAAHFFSLINQNQNISGTIITVMTAAITRGLYMLSVAVPDASWTQVPLEIVLFYWK